MKRAPASRTARGSKQVVDAAIVRLYEKPTAKNEPRCKIDRVIEKTSAKLRQAKPGQLAGYAIAKESEEHNDYWESEENKEHRNYWADEGLSRRMDLSDCDLRGVDFSITDSDTISNVDFSGSVFDGSMLSGEDAIIIFEFCDLTGVVFPSELRGRVWVVEDHQYVLQARLLKYPLFDDDTVIEFTDDFMHDDMQEAA